MADVGEIVRVAVYYTQPNASNIMNVFHFLISGANIADSALVSAVDGWVDSIWGAAWDDNASTSAEIDRFEVDVVATDGTVTRNLGGSSVNRAGAVISDPMPPGVAGYLMAYTSVPKARGSKYVPGIAEDRTTGGTFTGTALTALAAMLVVYLADVTVGGGTTLVAGLLSTALTEFIPFAASGLIDDRPAYQRRRKRGVGA